MIRAIAIDDEPPALKVLENFCGECDNIFLEKTFTSPNEALKHLRKYPVDLIFLDIQMPSISGIDFYKSIGRDIMAIFTTAYSEFAVEGFNLSAVDYLLKPYTFERFKQAVDKANDYFEFSNNKVDASPIIYVRADYSLVKVNLEEVTYIESLDDYIKIHLNNSGKVITRMTLKSFNKRLPDNKFIRVHRSFIVALDKIEKVRNKVIFIGETEVPISNSYEKNFFELFKE